MLECTHYEGLKLFKIQQIESESSRPRGGFPRVVWAEATRGHAQCRRSHIVGPLAPPSPESPEIGLRGARGHIGARLDSMQIFCLAQSGQK